MITSEKSESELGDPKFYEKVEQDMTEEQASRINQELDRLVAEGEINEKRIIVSAYTYFSYQKSKSEWIFTSSNIGYSAYSKYFHCTFEASHTK